MGNEKQVEGNAYMNYRSFENQDKTWGFTIFVNSVPYNHYRRIPYKTISYGFATREEADQVAGIFITRIRDGEGKPRLNKRDIDTMHITLKRKKQDP